MTVGGKAKVLTAQQWAKLEKVGQSTTHQTIWALLRMTACRSQEARLLRVKNVYRDPVNRIVHDDIHFPKQIRKGKKRSVDVPVTTQLKSYLEKYQPPESGYLFPSPRNPDKPISYEAIYKYLRETCEKAGMGTQKIATHSGRRSWITKAHESGMSLEAIRRITGHINLENLKPYIEIDQSFLCEAMENVVI
ncbi:tyrosine-type recombinase/integrase [Crocosphaera sp.]|uniref:tyrosine-type recombinase/integrase n=1 Tax=Crocosphaera sp. TaxID=2729996 RepID=UPI003F2895D8|nr:tyrosine-type recombinase/integrase [Crocosphaera sp.]